MHAAHGHGTWTWTWHMDVAHGTWTWTWHKDMGMAHGLAGWVPMVPRVPRVPGVPVARGKGRGDVRGVLLASEYVLTCVLARSRAYVRTTVGVKEYATCIPLPTYLLTC